VSPRDAELPGRGGDEAATVAPAGVFGLIAGDYRRIAPRFTWSGFLRAYCWDETFALVVWYRLAHHWSVTRPCLPLLLPCYLMLRRQNRRSGVTLSRHVRIGPGFRIEHAGKSYIHMDAVFGAECTIMHNVTVGVSHSRRGKPGVPVIGDRVFIGPNAVLYGGIRVGDDAMVGANSVVNRDVPAGTLAVGCPAVIKSAAPSGAAGGA
jgi:serine O-acetyltransferase